MFFRLDALAGLFLSARHQVIGRAEVQNRSGNGCEKFPVSADVLSLLEMADGVNRGCLSRAYKLKTFFKSVFYDMQLA